MRLYAITMIWYVFGLLTCALWAEYGLWGWNEMFWLWDKGKDLFLLLLIAYGVRKTPGIGILISFAVARLLLEIFITITGWNVNNIFLIRILFILYLLICLWWLLKELQKWQNSN